MPRAKRGKRQAEEQEPPTNVADVYLHVVEDVIQSVRDDFQMEGVDESVLLNLRQLWELNLMKSGVVAGAGTQEGGPAIREAGNSLGQLPDLNTAFGTAADYQTFTSTQEPIMLQYNPLEPNDSTKGVAGCVEPDIQGGRSPPYMLQRSPWMPQNQCAVDVHSFVKEEFPGKDEAGLGQSPEGKHFFPLVKEEKE